jgi:hypothetical protein
LNRIDKNKIILSSLNCILIPFFIPSNFINEGMGRYTYGIPLKYITLYQQESNSVWFFNNFFNGNMGMNINPGTFILNVLIIYIIVRFVANILDKKKGSDLSVQ